MNSWYHARSAANKWGGKPEDYLPVEEFIDSSKQVLGDVRHRAMYHHTQGVWVAQAVFGSTITTTAGAVVPVRLIAERHILEDLGWLPTPADWLRDTSIAAWMGGKQRKTMSLETLGAAS